MARTQESGSMILEMSDGPYKPIGGGRSLGLVNEEGR